MDRYETKGSASVDMSGRERTTLSQEADRFAASIAAQKEREYRRSGAAGSGAMLAEALKEAGFDMDVLRVDVRMSDPTESLRNYVGRARARDQEQFDTLSRKRGGPMEELAQRIEARTRDLNEIAHKLERHADAVHGPAPEEAGARATVPQNDDYPALTRLWVVLDHLDGAISRVAYHAGRNTTLAE